MPKRGHRRVDEDVAVPIPHRPGLAEFPHPVLHERDLLAAVYPWAIWAGGSGCLSSDAKCNTPPDLISARLLTNRLHELHGPDGKVDGRSPSAKRYRDFIDALIVEFGAHDPIRLREVALLKLELEKAQTADECSLEDSIRVQNWILRREQQLRAAQRRAASVSSPAQSLRHKLSSRYGGAP